MFAGSLWFSCNFPCFTPIWKNRFDITSKCSPLCCNVHLPSLSHSSHSLKLNKSCISLLNPYFYIFLCPTSVNHHTALTSIISIHMQSDQQGVHFKECKEMYAPLYPWRHPWCQAYVHGSDAGALFVALLSSVSWHDVALPRHGEMAGGAVQDPIHSLAVHVPLHMELSAVEGLPAGAILLPAHPLKT